MKQVAQVIPLGGGVNLNRDPRVIRPDQLSYAKNAFPTIPGVMGKRGGFRAAQIGMVTGGSRRAFINSWAALPEHMNLKFVADVHIGAVAAANRSRILLATNFDRFDAGTLSGTYISIANMQTDYAPTRFVNYRGQVVAIVPGIEGFYVLSPTLAGGYEWIKNTFVHPGAASSQPQVQSLEVKPRVGCQYKQRMVYGNFGDHKGNWLVFADKSFAGTLTPSAGVTIMGVVGDDVLSLNGRHVEVGSIEGEDIVTMQEVTLGAVGSAVESVLMLLTNRTCTLISGEILETNQSGFDSPAGLFGDYKEHRVNYEAGIAGADTLVKTPYGWIWASGDDVWILRGNSPERIGTNIRPALLNCPAAYRKQWSAGYANGVFVLQLVTQSTTVSDLGQTMTSYLHEYWYLDLRDGPPQSAEDARWYGPMVNELDVDENVAFSKALSVKESDGSERVIVPGQILDTAPSGHRDCILYDVVGGLASKDDLMIGITSASEWQASTAYKVGDIVRPKSNNTTRTGKSGFFHVVESVYTRLPFNTNAVNFTNGQVVTGQTSGATGTIVDQVDNGLTGYLRLSGVSGTFVNGEVITDPGGGVAFAETPTDGTSDSSEPNWATTSGGSTTDNDITWIEIRGTSGVAQPRLETGRGVGEFQADIRTRDDLLSDPVHEKLVRRIDISAAASGLMNLAVNVMNDQSADTKSFGTCSYGGQNLHLGFGKMGTGESGLSGNPGIGGVKSTAKTFRPSETELAQARSAKIQITDKLGYVIDDSNDYLVVQATLGGNSGQGTSKGLTLQVQLTQGEYADIDALLSHIVDRLNNYKTAFFAALGAVVGATPWSTSSAFSGVHPYMTRLRITYTDLGSADGMALLGADSDATPTDPATCMGDFTDTLYLPRSKKLLALLGYDTAAGGTHGNDTDTGFGVVFDTSPLPASLKMILFVTAGSPLSLDGVQVVNKYNSRHFDIPVAFVIVQPKTAPPLKTLTRS